MLHLETPTWLHPKGGIPKLFRGLRKFLVFFSNSLHAGLLVSFIAMLCSETPLGSTQKEEFSGHFLGYVIF
jgi:hypothetical protein